MDIKKCLSSWLCVYHLSFNPHEYWRVAVQRTALPLGSQSSSTYSACPHSSHPSRSVGIVIRSRRNSCRVSGTLILLPLWKHLLPSTLEVDDQTEALKSYLKLPRKLQDTNSFAWNNCKNNSLICIPKRFCLCGLCLWIFTMNKADNFERHKHTFHYLLKKKSQIVY